MAGGGGSKYPDPAMMSDTELLEEARRRFRWAERDLAFLRIVAERRPALAGRLAAPIADREADVLALSAAVWALLGERGEPA